MTTCHGCQRPLDKTAEGYVYCGEWVYHMGCEPSSFPRLGDREVSEILPVGTKLYAIDLAYRTGDAAIAEYEIKGVTYHLASTSLRHNNENAKPEDIGLLFFTSPEEAKDKAINHIMGSCEMQLAAIESAVSRFSALPSPPDSAPAAQPEVSPPQPA